MIEFPFLTFLGGLSVIAFHSHLCKEKMEVCMLNNMLIMDLRG